MKKTFEILRDFQHIDAIRVIETYDFSGIHN